MYVKQKPVEYSPSGVLYSFNAMDNKRHTYLNKPTSLVRGLLKYVSPFVTARH